MLIVLYHLSQLGVLLLKELKLLLLPLKKLANIARVLVHVEGLVEFHSAVWLTHLYPLTTLIAVQFYHLLANHLLLS